MRNFAQPCVTVRFGLLNRKDEDTVICETSVTIYKSERSNIIEGLNRQTVKILKPTGYVMHQQFNIQQLYVLPTLYLCVLYLSENKQRLVPLTT